MLVPLIEQPDVKQHRLKNKRIDIQLLRFLAIAAVLGFHLRPKSVPQGYLGVDMFFVISGYLMTVVTASSHGAITLATVTRFYERRLKRLCPVYLLTIVGTLIAGSILLVETDFFSLQSDSAWALAFGTNIQAVLKNDDYFQFGSDYKFLLHTWSLCVEMQFYAVAPFILAMIARSHRPILACSLLIALSLAFQSFVPSSIWSFDCVLSRIWQFLIGTVVFYMEKRENSITKKTGAATTFLFTVVMVILLLAPKLSQDVIYEIAVRVVATLLTALIMYSSTAVNEVQYLKPVTRVLILLGDASYSIYLVHWPMIVFMKYIDIFGSMSIHIQILCILIVALTQYYLFEKPLISYKTHRIFVICGTFYLFAIPLVFLPSNSGFNETSNVTNVSLMAMDPIIGNLQIAHDCRFDRHIESMNCPSVPELDAIVPKTTTKYVKVCGIKGPGKWTVFVTGNSFALFQVKAVQNALKGQFKMLYLVARPACLAFDGMNAGYKSGRCHEIVGQTDSILKTIKPDIMVIIQKLEGNLHFKSGQIGKTTTVEYLQNVFANYSKHTKKIFVVEPNSHFTYLPPNALAKAFKYRRPIDSFFITLKEHKRLTEPGMNQVVAAMKSCPKCEPIWIRNHLCDAEKCYLYDRKTKLAYFCDASHMSIVGGDAIMPAFRVAFEKTLREIRSL